VKTFVIIALLVIGFIWLVFNSYANAGNYATPAYQAPAPSAPLTYDIVYKIQTDGCTDFDTTYQLPDGTSQSSTYTCSTTEVARFRAHSGQFVSLSIQKLGDYSASASANFACVIELEGMPFKKVHSSGSYHIASCDGSVP